MPEFKDGPPMAINALALYQMVADPAFFTAVPLFFFMRDQAAAVVAHIASGKGDSGCSGCGDLRSQMTPLLAVFARVVRDVALTDNAAVTLRPLIDYVSARRGYRPKPVRVYYRGGPGKPVRSVEM